jgi:hypothetical protein
MKQPSEFSRRNLIAGIGCFIAAPAIIRVATLMPIKPQPLITVREFEINPNERKITTHYDNGDAIIEYYNPPDWMNGPTRIVLWGDNIKLT